MVFEGISGNFRELQVGFEVVSGAFSGISQGLRYVIGGFRQDFMRFFIDNTGTKNVKIRDQG